MVAMKPGVRRQRDPHFDDAWVEAVKSEVRARVEHPFRYLKPVFGYRKVRYRGLHQNVQRMSSN